MTTTNEKARPGGIRAGVERGTWSEYSFNRRWTPTKESSAKHRLD